MSADSTKENQDPFWERMRDYVTGAGLAFDPIPVDRMVCVTYFQGLLKDKLSFALDIKAAEQVFPEVVIVHGHDSTVNVRNIYRNGCIQATTRYDYVKQRVGKNVSGRARSIKARAQIREIA